jgi:hypothetical protein
LIIEGFSRYQYVAAGQPYSIPQQAFGIKVPL